VEEERDDLVVLTDEDGKDHEFSVIDIVQVDGRDYAILSPMDDSLEDQEGEDEDIIVIFRMETDEKGEDVLVEIEDDEEWEKVAETWEDMLEEEDIDSEDEDEEDAEE